MAPLPEDFAYDHYSAVYNALSFGIAGMGSAMIFVWLQIPNVSKKYRTALIINGLVTGIATYHYFRIFNSWVDAFDVKINADNTGYNVKLSGQPFNDASAEAHEFSWIFRRSMHGDHMTEGTIARPREQRTKYSSGCSVHSV